eukprot:c16882_g1_i1.p1 GENE.c16882_g1_i1~~c16882_g1_i1.p1  ORF type:complete len:310 (+),score=43.16 c16882_g1_i1:74-931(+)
MARFSVLLYMSILLSPHVSTLASLGALGFSMAGFMRVFLYSPNQTAIIVVILQTIASTFGIGSLRKFKTQALVTTSTWFDLSSFLTVVITSIMMPAFRCEHHHVEGRSAEELKECQDMFHTGEVAHSAAAILLGLTMTCWCFRACLLVRRHSAEARPKIGLRSRKDWPHFVPLVAEFISLLPAAVTLALMCGEGINHSKWKPIIATQASHVFLVVSAVVAALVEVFRNDRHLCVATSLSFAAAVTNIAAALLVYVHHGHQSNIRSYKAQLRSIAFCRFVTNFQYP